MHLSFFRNRLPIGLSVLLLSISLGQASSDQTCFAQESSDQFEPRSIREFRADLKTFMKLSKSEDAQLERNAIYNLCRLHCEVVFDSRFDTSQQLQGIRAVVAKRLETYAKDVKKTRLRTERMLAKHGATESTRAGESGDENSDQGSENRAETEDRSRSDTLGQFTDSEHDAADVMYESASDAFYTLGALSGGPNQLFGYAGGRLGPPWDHGEELVNLITSVIDPQFWRRNGGPGSIHYYRPQMVLIVRGTQQGNEEVGDLFEKLRANSGTQLNIGGAGGAIGN